MNDEADILARYRNRVICGDAVQILAEVPDRSVDAIITDPPWPDTCIDFCNGVNPFALWSLICGEIPRLTDRLIVILGCTTDPRFLIAVSEKMPFVRVCWLRRVPCSYRGPILYGADVAYVFGAKWVSPPLRLLGGESTAVVQTDRDPINPHPTKRHLHHMSWLVRHFTRPGHFIVDPFCGSGSTLVAAKLAGRDYCGIDIKQEYVTYSEKRLSEPDLFHQRVIEK